MVLFCKVSEGQLTFLSTVDLLVDPTLLNYLNSLLPSPYHLTATYDMLSPYNKELKKVKMGLYPS